MSRVHEGDVDALVYLAGPDADHQGLISLIESIIEREVSG